MTEQTKVHTIVEIEKMIDEVLFDAPNSQLWVWITRKGRLLLCGWQGHSDRLHVLFTDDLNPNDARYVINIDPYNYAYEGFFEQHWIKVTRGMINIPSNVTGKQKVALSKVIMSDPELFHFDDDGISTINTGNHNFCAMQIKNGSVHLLKT